MSPSNGLVLKVADRNAVNFYWPLMGGLKSELFHSEIVSKLRHYYSGSEIDYEGHDNSGIFCVLEGWLALSKSLENGHTQIIDFALPGDILLPAGADELTSVYSITAHTDVHLAIFRSADWEKLIRDIPDLSKLVAGLGASYHARISERFLRMGKGNAPMRIAYALLEFSVRLQSQKMIPANSFHIPLRQKQLGDFVGASSVHVCRTLGDFMRHSIVSINNHMDVQIHDFPALANIAKINLPQLTVSIWPGWRQ